MPSLQGIARRWRKLTGPAPMQDFSDYDSYWDQRGALKTVHLRWKLAGELIEPASSILDVGCGSGEFLAYLASLDKPGMKLHGIDFSERAVEMTRASGFDAERVDLLTGEIPGTYDYVTCFEVLEHIAEAEVVLQKLKGAFRKQLLISVPNIGYIGCRLRLGVFGRFPNTTCVMHIKEHVRHWTIKDFREWAAHFGLRVVDALPQTPVFGTPWKRFPGLFSEGLLYVLEHEDG